MKRWFLLGLPIAAVAAAPWVRSSPWVEMDAGKDDVGRPVSQATLEETLDRFVGEGMARLGVPGLAFAGVTTDSVVLARGWGVRDVNGGGTVDVRTGFYIASSTKSFVSLLTTLLDRQGWLDLDAPLTACLPGLDLDGTVDPASHTLRDLLRHTRGWENDLVNTRTAYTDFLDPAQLRRQLSLTTTVEDDGYFAYGNEGYVITDLCFREHVGVDWKELVETQVLVPAGMMRTTPFNSEAAATGNRALPHVWDGRRMRRIPTKIDDVMHAAGGLVTTADDAARWVRLHLGEGTLDGRRVFPRDAVREVLTRQVEADASFWAFSRDGYGLGWYDGTYGGERFLHHFGGYPGAQAHISLMPDRDLGAAAFSNGGGGNAYLLPHLTAALFYDLMRGRPDAEERAWDALAAAEADAEPRLAAARERRGEEEALMARAPDRADAGRYVGLYRSPARGNVIVARTLEGGLWIEWGAQEGPLVPAGDGVFLALWETRSPYEITFDLTGGGAARSLTWGGFGVPRVEPRLPGTG